jgi:preprotein translocase subunit SecA
MVRRLMLQVTDTFWLEHLDTMEYLRRSVSLRAYGQRDPLIEYRREGLIRYRSLEAGVAETFKQAFPRLAPADDARIKADEARIRAQLEAAGKEERGSGQPAVKAHTPGRNDMVTIRKGSETQTLKYKKAEPLLADGWVLVN